jgi:hypothetical protein
MMKNNIAKRKKVFLYILIAITFSLRFINLGYSDFIQDEVTTFLYRDDRILTHLSPFEYFLTLQKGPLQIIIARIPYLFVGHYYNELALRIPFALFSVASVIVFYYMLQRLTKNINISFYAALLFSLNGLIVGYGRIAQYQNLLFFFCFSSIYFYASLQEENISNKRAIKNTLLGTLLFSIAFYAHWYAVFILIPITYILVGYFAKKGVFKQWNMLIIFSNLTLAIVLILPFFVPYFANLMENSRNLDYAEGFFGKGESFLVRDDIKQFNLYNPFLTLPFYLIFGAFGIYVSRKFKIFSIWFLGTLLIFRFFISYSGLHFFHIFIPLIVLISYAINFLVTSQNKHIRLSSKFLFALIFVFFYIQSYLIFVDHKREYPMEREKILFWKTEEVTHEDRFRSKTGFPHKRYWQDINKYINAQNEQKGEKYGYYTNEDKGIARIYMDASVKRDENFYAIGIKKPYSLAHDYKFPQYKNKHTVHRIENEYGTTVVNIYWVGEQN